MNDKFIYVFNKEDRDLLISKKYLLLKNDTNQNIYIFENNKKLTFSELNITSTLSNILQF